MKNVFAAAAALCLIGGAWAGDKEWTKASKAQLHDIARAGAGLWEGGGEAMGPDGAQVEIATRVEITFEDGTLKGRWDEDADGSWDGEWTEAYVDGGYKMTATNAGDGEIDVNTYLADYRDATHYVRLDKWTDVGPDGASYVYKAWFTNDGDEATRTMKARLVGSEGDWFTIVEETYTRVDGAS